MQATRRGRLPCLPVFRGLVSGLGTCGQTRESAPTIPNIYHCPCSMKSEGIFLCFWVSKRKNSPIFSHFLPKTAFFRQIFSPKGLKRAKSYLKNSQFAPGHWNFSDAFFVSLILQPRNPRGHGESKTT